LFNREKTASLFRLIGGAVLLGAPGERGAFRVVKERRKLNEPLLGEVEFSVDKIGDELKGVFVVFKVAVAEH